MPYEIGSVIPIEVTFDAPGLFVAATFFSWAMGSPMQVGSPVAMTNFKGNSYGCLFTAAATGPYTVHKACYTDGTFTILNPDEPQGSDAFTVTPATPGAGQTTPTDLVGIIQNDDILVGRVLDDNVLIAVVEED